MKIVFVHLGKEHLGIQYLSAVLKEKGHEVGLVYDLGLFSSEDNAFASTYLRRKFEKKDILESILSQKPDIVAFSAYTTTYQWCCNLARQLREKTSTPIVFGGAHPTLVPEKVIDNDFVDYCLVGESEVSLLLLLDALLGKISLNKVNNLFYKNNGTVFSNPISDPISSLDSLPFPDKSLFEDHVSYRDDYMILTSRGCYFNCSYCCESFLNKIYSGKYFRRRSVDSVIGELKRAKEKYNFKEVIFFDSVLFTDKQWLKDMLLRYNAEIGRPFRCYGHTDFFDYEVGKLLKESGCYGVQFGVQTFNEDLRKSLLNRHSSNNDILNVFYCCDELKLNYDIDLIFGLPTSTIEDYELPLRLINNKGHLNRFKCYYFSYYPNLSISIKAKEMGILTKEGYENVVAGRVGVWFHRNVMNSDYNEWEDWFAKIYKIYPILPQKFINYLLEKKAYKIFKFVPGFLITTIQLFIGLIKRDYRFILYIKNYFFHFKKKFC